MWTIFKVFIEFATILLLFYGLLLWVFFFFFFWPRGMRDLTSLTGVEPIRPALEGDVLTS